MIKSLVNEVVETSYNEKQVAPEQMQVDVCDCKQTRTYSDEEVDDISF